MLRKKMIFIHWDEIIRIWNMNSSLRLRYKATHTICQPEIDAASVQPLRGNDAVFGSNRRNKGYTQRFQKFATERSRAGKKNKKAPTFQLLVMTAAADASMHLFKKKKKKWKWSDGITRPWEEEFCCFLSRSGWFLINGALHVRSGLANLKTALFPRFPQLATVQIRTATTVLFSDTCLTSL